MVNHGRTLLLNQHAAPDGDDFIFEEYTPPDFAPIELPSHLRQIHHILFGRNPDRAMLNIRGMELLTLVHNTELAEFLYALDNRITYWPLNRNFITYYFAPIVVGNNSQHVHVLGDAPTDDSFGRLQYTWHVTVEDKSDANNEFDVSVKLLEKSITDNQAGVFNNRLSTPINLPVSRLQIALSQDVRIGDSWNIIHIAKPGRDLGLLVADLDRLGESTRLKLFGLTPEEPILTFKNLWTDHTQLAYRLGGLVLAYIYNLDKYRQGLSDG